MAQQVIKACVRPWNRIEHLAAASPVVENSTMQIQIVSDIHLEYRRSLPTLPRYAPNLALLGDIGYPHRSSYRDFIAAQANAFDRVFVVMGNHEYYSLDKTVDEILTTARDVCARFNNVHLLDRRRLNLEDGMAILGCTLWSPLDIESSKRLNDLNMILIKDNSGDIRRLDRFTYFSWHTRDVQWLNRELKQVAHEGRRALVVTHHAPLPEMSGRFGNGRFNSAFVSNLRHLFRSPIVAFASGHVHSNCDIVHNGIRSVSNALGYPGEKSVGYRENVVIDL
jgi:hypothetical protein